MAYGLCEREYGFRDVFFDRKTYCSLELRIDIAFAPSQSGVGSHHSLGDRLPLCLIAKLMEVRKLEVAIVVKVVVVVVVVAVVAAAAVEASHLHFLICLLSESCA